MDPRTRPAEWATAVATLMVAVLAFTQDRNLVALVAVIGAALPAVITAIANAVPSLAKFRPTEVATAVAGITAAVILYAGNHDMAGLTAAITAFLPTLITVLVIAGGTDTPARPEPLAPV